MGKTNAQAVLTEVVDHDEFGGEVFTGRFTTSCSNGRGSDGGQAVGLPEAPIDEALSWAKARATRILVVLGDGTTLNAANEPSDVLETFDRAAFTGRRRPDGQAWRDRTDDDPPVTWQVYVELMMFSPETQDARGAARARIDRDSSAVVVERRPEDLPEWCVVRASHSRPMEPGPLMLTTEVRASCAWTAAQAAREAYGDSRWSTVTAVRPVGANA